MDNKSLNVFYRAFDYVGLDKNQVLKFSEQSSFTDELIQFSNRINDMAYNAIESIKTNLWELAKDDRELYFKKIIRDARSATKDIIKNVAITSEYQNGNLHTENADTFSIYVIKCWFYIHQFKQSLDVISADFNIDIFKIQNEIGIVFIEKRFIDALSYFGHNELFEDKQIIDDDGEVFTYKALKSQSSELPVDNNNSQIKVNNFNGQPLNEVKEHFNLLATTNSKTKGNNRPLLTTTQVDEFINSAFVNKTPPAKKIVFNKGNKDKAQIVSVFHLYYKNVIRLGEYVAGIKNERKLYINLLTDYFKGYEFEDIKNNFRS